MLKIDSPTRLERYPDFVSPDGLPLWQERLDRIVSWKTDRVVFQTHLLRPDSRMIPVAVELTGTDGVLDEDRVIIGQITDLSRVRNLENRLQKAGNGEVIASLAGGIGHEFNNILSSILETRNLPWNMS